MKRGVFESHKEVKKFRSVPMFLMCVVIMWILASAGATFAKVTLNGIVERYPLTEVKMKYVDEHVTWAKLNYELLPLKAEEDKIRILLSAKSPDVDIVTIHTSNTGQFAPFLEPLGPYVKKYWDEYKFGDVYPHVFDMVSYEEILYGLPHDMNGHLLFYRKDLFDEAGLAVPKTMEDYVNAVKKLTTNGRKGIALQLKQPIVLHFSYAWILWSIGGEYFDENWKPTLNSEKGIEALEYLKEFYKCAPAGSLDYWADEVSVALQQDKAATSINWITRCGAMDDPKVSKVVGKMEYAVPPARPPFPGGGFKTAGAFAISKYSKKKEEAFKLIAHLSSEEVGARFAANGIAPRDAVLHNPEFQKKYRWYPIVGEALKGGGSFPIIPEWGELSDIIAVEMHKFLMGKTSAKAALDKAAIASEALLKEKGYIK